jgi:hypothetical protein
MDVEAPRGLLRVFEEVEDPRLERTRLHKLGVCPSNQSPIASVFSGPGFNGDGYDPGQLAA